MSNINECREQIDRIDDEILELLSERAEYVIKIGEEKRKLGMALYVPSREKDIFERLSGKNKGSFSDNSIRSIFREIISASLSLEEKLKIAFLGPEGTFSHLAALREFGQAVEFSPVGAISDVFEEVEKGRASFGIVPVENSLEGGVNYCLDTFMNSNALICGEIYLEVSQHLMNLSGDIKKIKKIYSHSHAIAQSRKWLKANMVDIPIVSVDSTAVAAKIASEDPDCAAVCSEAAENIYGLKTVAKSIEDTRNNYTRFLLLSTKVCGKTGDDKSSIMFGVKNRAGSLYSALESLSKHNVNMSRIESRPSREKVWDYVFYIDMDGHFEDENVQNALDSLADHVLFSKFLGSYPRGVLI